MLQSAITRAREMAAAGAGIIDVGGESTRPGAEPVSHRGRAATGLFRSSRQSPPIPGIPVSIDTSKAEVARAALAAGAAMINDVTRSARRS